MSLKTLDYGWFFLRLALGLLFLLEGMAQFHAESLQAAPLMRVMGGVAIMLGIFVRPAAVGLLALMLSIFISGTHFQISLVHRSAVELLALIGFVLGGGGSFLALGAAVSGLRNRWYQ